MVDTPRSPLAPERFPELPDIDGVRMATADLGLKYSGRPDLLLVALAPDTRIAGVFTRSTTASAAVRWGREALKGGRGRAILVNAGNSIAFTGAAGDRFVSTCTRAVAATLDCPAETVFTASTGVIGEPADPAPIAAALPALAEALAPGGWHRAAQAIGTTDTFPKGASAQAQLGGKTVRLAGIAKGSGMIEPNMATMLGFLFTDAALPAPILQALLAEATEASFNAITVDGDCSTSDTVLLAATGAAGNRVPASIDDDDLADFRRALQAVAVDLATQIVRDGEGATKFVTIDVGGAEDDRAAKVVAKAIANSPLVKTALAGEDANWGRIVMAVGKAGETAPEDRLSVRMGGMVLATKGARARDFDEARLTDHMKGAEIHIEVDLGVGTGEARVWTCDLTHGYITINADYRS